MSYLNPDWGGLDFILVPQNPVKMPLNSIKNRNVKPRHATIKEDAGVTPIWKEEITVYRSEAEGLTRPAMGVWSLLIFFTDPGLIELNNLSHKDREEDV